MNTALEVRNLRARYGRAQVLHGIDLTVDEGSILVLLGANGAGKTSTLRAITQSIHSTGDIELFGKDLTRLSTDAIARAGVGHVVEGRGTFAELTVEENLFVGLSASKVKSAKQAAEKWYEHFEILRERRHQKAGLLSGGEQQMLALSRAMISAPRVMLLDEPSLGISPKLTGEIYETIKELNEQLGVTFLIVEQSAEVALRVADKAAVLENGSLVAEGAAQDILNDPRLRESYVGRSKEAQ